MTVCEFADHLNAKRVGNRWMTRCPAHDDVSPSLAVGEGDDGRILLKCFAGCNADEIVRAVNLTMADLFPRPRVAR